MRKPTLDSITATEGRRNVRNMRERKYGVIGPAEKQTRKRPELRRGMMKFEEWKKGTPSLREVMFVMLRHYRAIYCSTTLFREIPRVINEFSTCPVGF